MSLMNEINEMRKANKSKEPNKFRAAHRMKPQSVMHNVRLQTNSLASLDFSLRALRGLSLEGSLVSKFVREVLEKFFKKKRL